MEMFALHKDLDQEGVWLLDIASSGIVLRRECGLILRSVLNFEVEGEGKEM